jgi:hypothetical protein
MAAVVRDDRSRIVGGGEGVMRCRIIGALRVIPRSRQPYAAAGWIIADRRCQSRHPCQRDPRDAVYNPVTALMLSGRNAAALLSVVVACASAPASAPLTGVVFASLLSGRERVAAFSSAALWGGKPRPAPSSPAIGAGRGRCGAPEPWGRFDSRAAPAAQARHSAVRDRAVNGKACGGRPAVNPRSAPTQTGSGAVAESCFCHAGSACAPSVPRTGMGGSWSGP